MNCQSSNRNERPLSRLTQMKSGADTSALRQQLPTIVLCLCAMFMLSGCASTQVTGRQRIVKEHLPRPNHIWIYNFTASPEDVPPDSSFAQAGAAATPLIAERIMYIPLSLALYKVLVREVARYREVLAYLARYG